jgi:hypothetical protein
VWFAKAICQDEDRRSSKSLSRSRTFSSRLGLYEKLRGTRWRPRLWALVRTEAEFLEGVPHRNQCPKIGPGKCASGKPLLELSKPPWATFYSLATSTPRTAHISSTTFLSVCGRSQTFSRSLSKSQAPPFRFFSSKGWGFLVFCDEKPLDFGIRTPDTGVSPYNGLAILATAAVPSNLNHLQSCSSSKPHAM